MQSFPAYILVFHGSHDPRSQRAAKQLTESFRQKIGQTSQVSQAVGTVSHGVPESANLSLVTSPIPVQDVYLECVPAPLTDQIQHFIEQIELTYSREAIAQWQVIPVFLLAGMHVTEDLPAAIASLKAAPALNLTSHLGSHPKMRRLLNERMSLLPMEAWILVAHGSRRSQANQIIEDLADHLGVVTAYWSTTPNLEQRIQELATLGLRRIGILPYFLFSGGITDAIAQTISQISEQFPHLALKLVEPLDVNLPELADLLIDLAIKNLAVE